MANQVAHRPSALRPVGITEDRDVTGPRAGVDQSDDQPEAQR
jgi:hypothetical protein